MPLGDFTNHLPVIDGKGRFMDNIFIERLWRSLNMSVFTYMPGVAGEGLRLGFVNG